MPDAKVVLVCPECYGTDVAIEERKSPGGAGDDDGATPDPIAGVSSR